MNLIYEATHEAKHDMRTNIGCLSAWSNQGLIAYTVERTLDGRQLMELRIFNSGIFISDFVCISKILSRTTVGWLFLSNPCWSKHNFFEMEPVWWKTSYWRFSWSSHSFYNARIQFVWMGPRNIIRRNGSKIRVSRSFSTFGRILWSLEPRFWSMRRWRKWNCFLWLAS